MQNIKATKAIKKPANQPYLLDLLLAKPITAKIKETIANNKLTIPNKINMPADGIKIIKECYRVFS